MTGADPLEAARREALAHMVGRVPINHLAAIARDLLSEESLPAPFPGREPAALVDHLDGLPPGVDGVPLLVHFAERLAHERPQAEAIELHRWVEAAGRAAGLDAGTLRRLHRSANESFGPPSHDPTQRPPGSGYTPERSKSDTPSGVNVTVTAPPQPAALPSKPAGVLRIEGDIPVRNSDFTGRKEMLLDLQRTLESGAKASVLPQTLHGSGGVGKTQLAIEYVHQYMYRYDLIWWIPSEHKSLVLTSLQELGRRLGLSPSPNLQQAAAFVIEELAQTDLRWLLVFDNANRPEDISSLVPTHGGHVILTSRNQAWSSVWGTIKVDVFDRLESVTLIRKRAAHITESDAHRLAEHLGDLPLALEQATAWQLSTGMPVDEYLALHTGYVREITRVRGTTVAYPINVAAFVLLALERLRTTAPAVAELTEMFAFLGAEPVSKRLLERGRLARIGGELGKAFNDLTLRKRAVRELHRYGLAKVDAGGRIQVHRLVQLVLREMLEGQARITAQNNARQLLAASNPGDPDDSPNWSLHAEIGPHIAPAGLIEAEASDARQVVLDQIRYLWVIGDNAGARELGESTVKAWEKAEGYDDLGVDGERTLIATRHWAQALRSLGFNERARTLCLQTYHKFRASPRHGPDNEHTLLTSGQVALDMRIAGNYREAFLLDQSELARYPMVFGSEHAETLLRRGNLAVNLRMLGDFPQAQRIDADVVREWLNNVGETDRQTLLAQTNLARDLYGLGSYREALELQRRTVPALEAIQGSHHRDVLLAKRTLAIALRKTGDYERALSVARENYLAWSGIFGPDHEHSLAAEMTYANTLRVAGDQNQLAEAGEVARDGVSRYERVFGAEHPLTLVAKANLAIALRELGLSAEALELDEKTLEVMTSSFGRKHGYTLCVISNHANNLVRAGDRVGAHGLSEESLRGSRETRGEDHPYTHLCAINAAFDRMETGDRDGGQALLDGAIAKLVELYGAEHPETEDAVRGRRAECDIEPPPT